ncbi:hypothetical protein [Victivallis sp. Marseille-Q1083]|uniref:hypothetical protein n=1 Tax=Victivallis sp. Marseille-Q1083 TaxID=2717288 RepID=UPI0015890998|nr:hypothetical protein [Victivallis sp. Marseille-Q1083]
MKIIIALILLLTMSAGFGGESLPVLCLAGSDCANQGLDGLDQKAVERYRAAGYELFFDYYQRVKPETLEQYAVIVGMIPQLYPGSRAIGPGLAAALDRYMRRGGAVLVIAEPSYYTGGEFHTQLQPFLEPYGAALGNEIPYDPAHTFIDWRGLPYRLLTTGNLAQGHPVTAGINALILPLDSSWHTIQTYTMRGSDDWGVAVRGEPAAFTTSAEKLLCGTPEPGWWKEAPPLLAIRPVGAGKLAIFSTSSRYFFYDAYHWAVSEGMVLEKGNGLRLMDQLFQYLAANCRQLPLRPAVPELPAAEATGNLPVLSKLPQWYQLVLDDLAVDDYSVIHCIDAGSIFDLPYSAERGYGHRGGVVRARPELSAFHPTAFHSRRTAEAPFRYRFDRLPAVALRLGMALWKLDAGQAGKLKVGIVRDDQVVSLGEWPLPDFGRAAGPRLVWLDLPPEAVVNGTLELEFNSDTVGCFTELAELFIAGQGKFLTSPEAVAARSHCPPEGECLPAIESPRRMRTGLIGLHSAYTDGLDSVAAMARSARESGLDFLVYSDDWGELTAEEWQRLEEECRAVSGPDLKVFPGFELKTASDRFIRARFYGPVGRLPIAEELGLPYELFWKYFGGAYARGGCIAAELAQPGSNPVSPFFQRFWKGFSVLTLDENGRIVEDSRKLFRDLTAAGYGPRPRVGGIYRSAEEVRQAARFGWKTLVWPGNMQFPPDSFGQLGHAAISSGPRFRWVLFHSDFGPRCLPGSSMSFRDAAWLYAILDVEYDGDISEAILTLNGREIRHFYPECRRFAVCEPVRIVEQGALAWQIRAADGTEAMTGSFEVIAEEFRNQMCADNQNSIGSVTRSPGEFKLDGRDIYQAHSYWHTGENTGYWGPMRAASNLIPRIVEAIFMQIGRFLHPAAILRVPGGRESHIEAEMRIESASAHHYVVRYDYRRPGSLLSSSVKLTAFRPNPAGGATAILAENAVTAEQELPPETWEELQLLGFEMLPELPVDWRYTLKTPDGLETVKFSEMELQKPQRRLLCSDGGMWIWPNQLASIGIFPLDGRQYEAGCVRVGEHHESLAMLLTSRHWPKGETIVSRLLLLLTPQPLADEAALEALRVAYTKRGELVKAVLRGQLERADYVLDFAAENGAATWEMAPAGGVDPIAFRVENLRDNWSGLILSGGELERAAIDGGILYGTADCSRQNIIIAGHPLLADRGTLVIEWVGVVDGAVRARIHNPEATPLAGTLWTNPAFPVLPAAELPFALAPGESRFVRLIENGNGGEGK